MRSSPSAPLLLALLAAAGSPAVAGEDAPREVRVGLLLPADEALAREASRGAAAAASEAGGVRVLEHRVRGPWGSEAGEVVRMIYDEGAEGIVTAPDRPGSHLALQVAAKAHRPVVLGSEAAALTRVPLPWAVRAVPDERAMLDALLGTLPAGARRVSFHVDGDREGERLAEEIRRAVARSGRPAPAAGTPEAMLLAAAPASSAATLRDLRAAGWKGSALLHAPRGDAAAFLAAAGAAAEGAVVAEGLPPFEAVRGAVLRLVRAVRASDGSPEDVLRVLREAAPEPVRIATVRGGALVPREERKP